MSPDPPPGNPPVDLHGGTRILPRRRLTVLHASVPTTDGVANVVSGYVRDQLARGWNVHLAVPSEGGLGFDARAVGATVHWWQGGADHGRGLTRESLRLKQVVDEVSPDVVHLHSAKAGLVGRLVIRGNVPTLFQPHAWSFLAARGGVRAASVRWERYAARWTSELICVSEAERGLAEHFGVVAPATVLPNGVDLARFGPQGDDERRRARRALGLDDAPTALCLGRLCLQKGQQDLLADWAAVRGRVPDAQLLLVGDGPDRAALRRQSRHLGGVRLVGARTDVQSWLAAADVVVVPSRWEGMSLVPLEAMASSRSVVATDVSGIADSVPRSAGAVVPVGDGDALVDAVVARLTSPGLTEDEGWAGRAHVEQHHDATASARELARVYLRLVSSRRAR